LQFLWKPSDKLSVTLGGDWYHERDNANGWHVFGPGSYTTPTVANPNGTLQVPIGLTLGGHIPTDILNIAKLPSILRPAPYFNGARLDIHYSLSDEVTLRSLSAYRRSEIGVQTELHRRVPLCR